MIARSSALSPPVTSRREVSPLHRTLGTMGMIGAPFFFFSFAATSFEREKSSVLGAVLGFIFAIGWLSNVIGLYQLRAAGTRLGGRIVLGIEIIGVVLAAGFQVYEAVSPKADTVPYHIMDIAWPLSMVTLLVIGIMAIVARRLQGWARFVPLFCALWLPVSIPLGILFGTTGGLILAGAHVSIAWFLLGYAVRNGGEMTA